jgi:methanethiol S-methyltransferase
VAQPQEIIKPISLENQGADKAFGRSLVMLRASLSRCRSFQGRKTMTQINQTLNADMRGQGNVVGRIIAFVYGIVAYVTFFVTFLYSIGFVEDLLVPKTIDGGSAGPTAQALIVNLVLMSIFAIQHSVMARPQFKQWWTKFVPPSVERTTYVLLASLALALLLWQWQPMPAVVWQITDAHVAMTITCLSFVGWLIVLTSTFLINHF